MVNKIQCGQMGFEPVDDSCYESPLDDVDPVVFFAAAFEEFRKKETDFFTKFTNSIHEVQKQHLTFVYADATKRKQEQKKEADEEKQPKQQSKQQPNTELKATQ